MKKIKTIIILLYFSISLNAQIPNSGFENWIDGYTPSDWITSNVPTLWTPIVRSTNSHSGSSSIKMEVVTFNGIPVYPTMSITFPVTQAYGALNGYYQLHQVNNTEFLGIASFYFVDGAIVGNTVLELNVASSTYLPFSIALDAAGTVPDSIWIQMIVISDSDDPGIGAFVLVDDLSFGQTTNVEQVDQIPSKYSLKQNYPNPFNPSTIIEFSIPTESFVELKVFDILGEEVITLASDNYAPGTYKADFMGANLPSGIYFARISAGNFIQTKKMILTK